MSESVEVVGDLDDWIYGAEKIGAVANLNTRQAYYALEQGYLDGEKFGKRKWRSTKRRLLKPAAA